MRVIPVPGVSPVAGDPEHRERSVIRAARFGGPNAHRQRLQPGGRHRVFADVASDCAVRRGKDAPVEPVDAAMDGAASPASGVEH